MSKRIPIAELTRLAFIDAEINVAGYADAHPDGSTERADALELLAQYRAYRLRRWGKTQFEAQMERATLVSLSSLMTEPKRSTP